MAVAVPPNVRASDLEKTTSYMRPAKPDSTNIATTVRTWEEEMRAAGCTIAKRAGTFVTRSRSNARMSGRYSMTLAHTVAAMAIHERPGIASNTATAKRSATIHASQIANPPSAARLRAGSLQGTVPATIATVATATGTAAIRSIR